MTTTAIAKQSSSSAAASLEKVLIGGDLAALSPDERIMYYRQTCDSLGLNALTKPFDYIKLNGRLTLYAKKDATDQLRKINGVSIQKPDIQQIDNLIIVTVSATDKSGRADSDIGVVQKNDMGGNLANALMKAVTKAKRRVTLSICGLGMLDETEVETIPDAQHPGAVQSPSLSPSAPVAAQRELSHAETSLRQQLQEISAAFGLDSPVIARTLDKFDRLTTLSDKEDMVAGARQKLEARRQRQQDERQAAAGENEFLTEREVKKAAIKAALAAQDWDAEETEAYLEQFNIRTIDSADDEQLDALYLDMSEAKMI